MLKLPKNYHVEVNEATGKYVFYYLGRKEGKKDYLSKKYFSKYDDAVKEAVMHFNNKKNK